MGLCFCPISIPHQTLWYLLSTHVLHNFVTRFGGKSRMCLDVELVGHITCHTIRDLVCTMLQKLSKCEVKAWLCCNLIILPSLKFYVKSNFGKFKLSTNVIFGNFRGFEFWFLVNLSNFQVPNLPKFKFRVLKLPKMTFLDRLNSPKFDFT